MSLLQATKSRAGAAMFRQHMRKPLLGPSWKVAVASRGTPQVMGTALDYAMRMGFLARWPERSQTRPLLAETAVDILSWQGETDYAGRGQLRVTSAKARFAEMVDGPLTESQARACLELAFMEVLGRSGAGPRVQRYRGEVDREATQSQIWELQELYELITWDAFVPQEYVALNPEFGEGTRLLGGADADLVLDGVLIDIKTTKDVRLKLEDVRQVVAYALLANAFGVDGRSVEIERVGIYYSRSGELLCWDLKECVDASGRAALLEFLEGWES